MSTPPSTPPLTPAHVVYTLRYAQPGTAAEIGGSAMEGLSISSATNDGVCVLSLDGDLDVGTAPRLNVVIETALEGNPSRLILDLAAVTFIDSSGVGAFVAAKRRGAGVPVVLHRPSEQCRQMLTITRLDTEFEITE